MGLWHHPGVAITYLNLLLVLILILWLTSCWLRGMRPAVPNAACSGALPSSS